jgi:type VI secretion system protein ImpF
MARDPNQSVTISVIDRLIDLDPKSQQEAPMTRAQSVRQLKQSVRRDLEWLLNTRRIPDEQAEENEDLRNSLLTYGLPDVSHFTIASMRDMNRLAWLIEGAVSTFEPRLEGAKVLMEPMNDGSRMLRFTIEGLLRMSPAPERVSFDTVLELSSGSYQVKGEGGA